MIKQERNLETVSPVRIDPFLKLTAAMVIRALKDFGSNDPITALDAYDWLSNEGPEFLKILGFTIGPKDYFIKMVTNDPKFTRITAK